MELAVRAEEENMGDTKNVNNSKENCFINKIFFFTFVIHEPYLSLIYLKNNIFDQRYLANLVFSFIIYSTNSTK